MMPDREKVIKEYEDYVNSYISLTTSHDYEFEMHKAALALLKEQEAVKPIRKLAYTKQGWFCGNCDNRLNRNGKYCSFCGKPILWEGR